MISFMKRKQPSEANIRELVKAFQAYKNAEKTFRDVRDKIMKDVELGKYEGKAGVIAKTSHVREYTDHKQILEDYPEIDVAKYTHTKEVELITITPTNN